MTAAAAKAGLAAPIRMLSILLLVQLGLAALLWWPEDPSARAARPLLEFDRAAIQELQVTRSGVADAAALRLRRTDSGSWGIASAGGYPADQQRVEDLIDSLLAIRVRDAIASQSTSHESLGVGDEGFGRRVSVATSQGEATLWLSAATSDSVHVRSGDSPDVFVARGVSESSFQDAASHYAGSSFVAVDPASIAAFTLRNEAGTLSFVRVDSVWTLEAAEPPVDLAVDSAVGAAVGVEVDVEIDSGAVEEFLAAVSSLQLAEPVGREAKPEWGLSEGARIEWMEVSDDQSIAGGYVVGSDQGARRYVQTVGGRLVALVASDEVDRVRSARADDFTLAAPPLAEPPVAPMPGPTR